MHSNWQQEFFRGVALELWRRAMTPEITRAEADFLERTLQLPAAARILDVPCGNGRHALALAARGYQLTGIDLSDEFIAEARAADPAQRWVNADMRTLPWRDEFDAAYCFGNSFGHFPRDEAAAFLAAVAAALKTGARFLLDTGMAAESILPTLTRNRWMRFGDLFMLSENRYDPAASRLDIDYTFIHQGEIETRPAASFVLTVNEICRLHTEAALHPIHLYGSLNAEPYQLGSPRLLLVSEKR